MARCMRSRWRASSRRYTCVPGAPARTTNTAPLSSCRRSASRSSKNGRYPSSTSKYQRNAGAPLLLASPYGGEVTLAGVLLDHTLIHESDPRALPVRLSRSICVDAALELIRGSDAQTQRARVTQGSTAPSTGGDS